MYNKNNDNNDNNVKNFPGKTFFVRFQLTVFKNNSTFMEKKQLLCIQPLSCTAKLDKFYAIYFGRFEPLTNSGRSLT